MDDFDKSYKLPRRIEFRLGHSIVSATGKANDSKHLNVVHLSILRSPFERTLLALILRLPIFLQTLIATIFPGLFLPHRVVLKKVKPGWLEEFENEKLMYERLQSLQGRVIPKFYGEAQFEGTRALILSEVVGIMPWEQRLPPLQADEFKELVEVAFQELNAFGLAYDDVKLDNMIIVQDRVVLVDLESVYEAERIADQHVVVALLVKPTGHGLVRRGFALEDPRAVFDMHELCRNILVDCVSIPGQISLSPRDHGHAAPAVPFALLHTVPELARHPGMHHEPYIGHVNTELERVGCYDECALLDPRPQPPRLVFGCVDFAVVLINPEFLREPVCPLDDGGVYNDRSACLPVLLFLDDLAYSLSFLFFLLLSFPSPGDLDAVCHILAHRLQPDHAHLCCRQPSPVTEVGLLR
ncbi:hypothetical protein AK830_g4282 [Neonectria ditissima]|uniref:Protein kinase domain-containing protein n=1 Tax=Neonectria ditissima TaxID=78410 RepID=A0A0P7BGE4_9HYPO|nr:hypothetical protein AK830_g4282 [Neonectria ditissima]